MRAGVSPPDVVGYMCVCLLGFLMVQLFSDRVGLYCGCEIWLDVRESVAYFKCVYWRCEFADCFVYFF